MLCYSVEWRHRLHHHVADRRHEADKKAPCSAARRSHRPLVTSSVLSPLIVTCSPSSSMSIPLQRVTSLRRREKTPYIYCVVLVASHHGVAWWRNGRASDLRSRRREFDSRPRRGCVTTLVVTFFNHNFVNCKATLILAIKIY